MRIGLVSYEYPPQQGLGGVGTYMFRLAGALGRAGHEVHVITGPSDRAPVEQARVVIHRVPAELCLDNVPRPLRWLYWQLLARPMSRCNPTIWHWLRWDLASLSAIARLDERRRLDLVEAPEHAGNGWVAGRLHRWPVVLRMHCPWELFVRINRLPFNLMNRLLARLERSSIAHDADCITAPSQAMRRQVEGSWTLRRPVRVVPNFMDVPPPQALPPDGGVERIVCAGRIEPLKGQDTLARAFAILAPRHPRAQLWIVGPDRWPGQRPFSDMLPQLVPDPAIRARIHMPGLVPLQDISEHLRTCRVAVVPSIGFESFNYFALEAIAATRPKVVTATGALSELIEHEQNGLVVTPSDPYELAAAIERLLEDRELSESVAQEAHATARDRYDTHIVLPRMLEAYEEAAMVFGGTGLAPAAFRPAEAVGAS